MSQESDGSESEPDHEVQYNERLGNQECLSLHAGPSLRLVTETRSGSDPNSVTNGAQLRGSEESPREQWGSQQPREQNIEKHEFGEVGDQKSRSLEDSREKQQSPVLSKSPPVQEWEETILRSQEQRRRAREVLAKNADWRQRRESVLSPRLFSETAPAAATSLDHSWLMGDRGKLDQHPEESGDRGVSMEAVPGQAGARTRVRVEASGDRNLDKPDSRSREDRREVGPVDSDESDVGDVCTDRFSKTQRRSSGYETEWDQDARRRQDLIQETRRVSFLIDPLRIAEQEERIDRVDALVQKQQEWTKQTLQRLERKFESQLQEARDESRRQQELIVQETHESQSLLLREIQAQSQNSEKQFSELAASIQQTQEQHDYYMQLTGKQFS